MVEITNSNQISRSEHFEIPTEEFFLNDECFENKYMTPPMIVQAV